MAEENQTLFQEIDEAMRADRMLAFWNAHRNTIIACCAGVILGTAVSVGWRNYADHRATQATKELVQAQALAEAGKFAEAAAAFGKVADNYSKEASLARLRQAQTLALSGDKDKAAQVLAKGGSDKGFNALMALQAAESAPATSQKLRAQAESGKPFAPAAKELLALSYRQEDKPEEAARTLEALKTDTDAPGTLRERAAQLQHIVGE